MRVAKRPCSAGPLLASETLILRAPAATGAVVPAPAPTPAPAVFEELTGLKKAAAAAKSSVGPARWARLVDAGGPPPNGAAVASRAFFKLREIALSCALPRPAESVHLCEAPGGFVQATAEFAAAEWRWWALSQGTEGAPRFRSDLLPPHGTYVEGDVADAACTAALPCGTADLVTADGANPMDHDRLEELHHSLLLAQTLAGIACLRPGGHMVIKFFEGGTHATLQWLAWLTLQFQLVSIIKPTASRPTNSERYAVCRILLETRCHTPLPDALVLAPCWEEHTYGLLGEYAQRQCRHLRTVVTQCGTLGVK